MYNKSNFAFSTLAQVEYFAKIGQMIASNNNTKPNINIDRGNAGEILCVVINDSYFMYSDLVSAARKAWLISNQNLKNVKFVCAVCNCTIVGVYKLLNIEESAELGRHSLNIEIADIEIQERYLGRTFNGKDVNGAVFYM